MCLKIERGSEKALYFHIANFYVCLRKCEPIYSCYRDADDDNDATALNQESTPSEWWQSLCSLGSSRCFIITSLRGQNFCVVGPKEKGHD